MTIKKSFLSMCISVGCGLSPLAKNKCPSICADIDETSESGSNATLGGVIAGDVYEDGTLQATGQMTISDPDNGEDSFVVQSSVSTNCGTFSIDATGYWTYDLDNNNVDVQALNYGQTMDEQIVVHSVDGTAEIVTITIHGANESSISEITTSFSSVPLLETASITVSDRDSTDTATMQYKKSVDSTWLNAMNLQFEPVDGSLTGIIVYLEEDTQYDVKITITKADESQEQSTYQVTTMGYPVIDPAKDYLLSDIYTSGKFDVESLGLFGTENAWARVAGDITIDGSAQTYAMELASTNNYIVFEGITIVGGGNDSQWDEGHAILANGSHHLWFKNCDISEFGRIAYSYDGNNVPIDGYANQIYQDAAFSLKNCGCIVIDECEVSQPNCDSNMWSEGAHPQGCNAMIIRATHTNPAYSGQYVIRNSRFYGDATHQFGDIIESADNAAGGFLRDSAIYGNYFAYCADDIIELDGKQNNVAFFDNELEHWFCGVSMAANAKGPNWVFNNYLHDSGDANGDCYTAFKEGGLTAYPEGRSNIFFNLVKAGSCGIATGGLGGDATYRNTALSNVFILDDFGTQAFYPYADYGYTLDGGSLPSSDSYFTNNYIWNLNQAGETKRITTGTYTAYYNASLENQTDATTMYNDTNPYLELPIPAGYRVNNLIKVSGSNAVIGTNNSVGAPDPYGPNLWLTETISVGSDWTDNGDGSYSIDTTGGSDGTYLTCSGLSLSKSYLIECDAVVTTAQGGVRICDPGIEWITTTGSYSTTYDPAIHTSVTAIAFKRDWGDNILTISNISIREVL